MQIALPVAWPLGGVGRLKKWLFEWAWITCKVWPIQKVNAANPLGPPLPFDRGYATGNAIIMRTDNGRNCAGKWDFVVKFESSSPVHTPFFCKVTTNSNYILFLQPCLSSASDSGSDEVILETPSLWYTGWHALRVLTTPAHAWLLGCNNSRVFLSCGMKFYTAIEYCNITAHSKYGEITIIFVASGSDLICHHKNLYNSMTTRLICLIFLYVCFSPYALQHNIEFLSVSTLLFHLVLPDWKVKVI